MESPWSPEQNKAFEQALALFDDAADVDRWEKIANYVEGKSAAEVIRHYEKLLQDVEAIECGMVPLPKYSATSFMPIWLLEQPSPQPITTTTTAPPSRAYEQERKKGVPWTEEEHRKFLLGLKKYGKGDWRSISRNFVVSRTPTQVASHAQKYFLRLSSGNKEKKRSSIHDITSAGIAEIKQQDNAVATSPPSATSGPPQNMGFPSSPSSPLGANMTNPVVPQIESGHGMFPPNTSGSYQTNGFEPHPLKHGAPNSAMFCVHQVDMSGNPDAYYVGNLMSRD